MNYPRALRRARLRIEFLRAENCRLQREVDALAFDILPEMVQGRVNAEWAKIGRELTEGSAS